MSSTTPIPGGRGPVQHHHPKSQARALHKRQYAIAQLKMTDEEGIRISLTRFARLPVIR